MPTALIRRIRLASLALAASLAAGPTLSADLPGETYLRSITLGSSLTQSVDRMGHQGYELADGTPAPVDIWYRRRWTDLHVDFLTQLRPDFGILWGVSLGEAGPKYRIDPALRLGLIWQIVQRPDRDLTLSANVTLGGRLREFPCLADYGEIGGTQPVNCRYAASVLPPEETLQYLVDEAPADRLEIRLSYTIRF